MSQIGETKTCQQCDNEFEASNPNSRYCSPECAYAVRLRGLPHVLERTEPPMRGIGMLSSLEFELLDALDVLGGVAHEAAIGSAMGASDSAAARAVYRAQKVGLCERIATPTRVVWWGPTIRNNEMVGVLASSGTNRHSPIRRTRTSGIDAAEVVYAGQVRITDLGRRMFADALLVLDERAERAA